MEPIISPWTIYFLSVVEPIAVFIGLAGGAFGCYWLAKALHSSLEGDEDAKPKKKYLVLFFVLLFVAFTIPTKNTIIAMYAAKYVTKNNVVTAVDVARKTKDELKQDVIDVIKAFTNKADSTSN